MLPIKSENNSLPEFLGVIPMNILEWVAVTYMLNTGGKFVSVTGTPIGAVPSNSRAAGDAGLAKIGASLKAVIDASAKNPVLNPCIETASYSTTQNVLVPEESEGTIFVYQVQDVSVLTSNIRVTTGY